MVVYLEGGLHQMKVGMRLAVYCNAIGAARKKSDILHGDTGRGMFAALPVGKESIVGYYDGLLVYENLRYSGSRFKTYAESKIGVTREVL